MRSKYHNKRVTVNGVTFASGLESRRYQELLLLMRTGIVKEIELQPKYLLQEAFKKNGKHIRAIHYIADFHVTYADGHQEIEDVKGRFITPEFRLKQKLFEHRYPDLTIKIVTARTKH